ncbi:hypothetical protein ACH5RR_011992 [Cinchona calisaya]|uniref:CCHC-type domain-containing protein n=1 Tax=Cinchona calisaya TaxID=153742 RepID=A0ABD3A900_9GENT
MIQQVAMKVCRQNKMMRQLTKDRNQRRKDLGSFCEQFGLPSCETKIKRRNEPKIHKSSKPSYSKPYRKHRHKFRKSNLPTKNPIPTLPNSNSAVCYKCKKPGHIVRFCKFVKRLNLLNLEDSVVNQLNSLLLETSDSDSNFE